MLAARSLCELDPHRLTQTFAPATCGGKKSHRYAKKILPVNILILKKYEWF